MIGETTAPEEEALEKRPGYSNSFANLCKDSNDLPGLLAYALYRQAKQEWASQKLRTADEAAKYAEFHLTPSNIENLRRSAEERMELFAHSIRDQARILFQEEAWESGFSRLDGSVKAHMDKRTGLLNSIGANIAAWVITIGITAIALVAYLLPNLAEQMADRVTDRMIPSAVTAPAPQQ
ncbi:hypothetical protein [Telmatospirillum sp. J64-1]|uniref:hypothetical protein n=1 Tax=Telmatospirillum sp. J64-1 TaxID=2502183 RepID=UPI00115F1BF4|nr:hypothetical protein [Telmatospirillum sp. J64-1]